MSTPYNRSCPVARALDIIGDRWTILIVRDLLLKGPRKFIDFELSLQAISPNTLSARLKTLEETGLIERRFYEQHPPRACSPPRAASWGQCCARSGTGAKNTRPRRSLSCSRRMRNEIE